MTPKRKPVSVVHIEQKYIDQAKAKSRAARRPVVYTTSSPSFSVWLSPVVKVVNETMRKMRDRCDGLEERLRSLEGRVFRGQ
jgi:hypothetical protein